MIALRRPSLPAELVRRLRTTLRREPRARAAAFVVLVGVATALAMLVSPPATVSYEIGAVADRAIRAPRSVAFISDSLTNAERERAAGAVVPVYRREPAVAVAGTGKLAATIAAITSARGDQTLSRDERIVRVSRFTETAMSEPIAVDIVDMPAADWDATAREMERALQNIYAQSLREEQVDQAVDEMLKAWPASWTDQQRRVASAIVPQHVQANEVPDPATTLAAQGAARSAVAPIQVQVLVGEVVVREGSVVTQQDVEKLRALDLADPAIDLTRVLGHLGWALLIAGVLGLFVQRYAEETWADDRRLVLIGLSLVAIVAVGRVVAPGTLAVYFAPFAAVAMMLTLLAGGRTALATQIAGALHVGIMTLQVEHVAYVLVPAILGMAAIRRATTAREFVAGAFNVAGGNLGVIGAFLLLARPTDVLGLIQLGTAAVASGALSGLVAFGATGFIGHLFRITTVFELRELSDPNHPLLRQLLLRTPGTYHHSLLVANLAERAAEVIGADGLTARVGSYYHDIGKMRNPLAFIENQTGGKNPHDDLDPLVSAQIVSAHIRDGLVLAERYHLPEQFTDMIPAHHGTLLVKYFWQTARERGQNVDEQAFRYPGPKPRTREAGIVMLADGVEASVRSLAEKTPDTIRGMVDKIVDERVADGQLDDCDLTLRDIHRTKDAFCELLLGVYHERIPYPEDRIARIDSLRPPAAS